MKVKIRKGDTVEVICGRSQDKGRRGEVIKVMPEKHRIVVQGINMRKKHQGEVQAQGRSMTPGIIEFEGSIDISNVMLVCPKCKHPTRVDVYKDEHDIQRVCKKCQAMFD